MKNRALLRSLLSLFLVLALLLPPAAVQQTWAGLQISPAVDQTAWTTYTPTVTAQSGTITTYTATGKYKVIGKTVLVTINITITAHGTAASNINATLPVTAINSGPVDAFAGRENNNSGYGLCGYVTQSGTTVTINKSSDGSTVAVDGNVLAVSGAYQIP